MRSLLLFIMLAPIISFGQTKNDILFKIASESNEDGIKKHRAMKWKEAVEDFSRAIRLFPEEKDFYFNRAESRAMLGDYYDAIEDYDKVIELDPYYGNGEALEYRAILKYDDRVKDYYGSISDWNKVIEFNPSYSEGYMERAHVKNKSGNTSGACADLIKAKKLGVETRKLAQYLDNKLIELNCN